MRPTIYAQTISELNLYDTCGTGFKSKPFHTQCFSVIETGLTLQFVGIPSLKHDIPISHYHLENIICLLTVRR